MSITAQQRTMILAAVAALGVGGVAADAFLRSKDVPTTSSSPAPSQPPSVSVLPGAPPGDLDELRKRYRPIVLKGPFKTRDFKPRRARPRPTPSAEDPEPVRPSKPGDLLLRLTTFLGHGASRVGLFEERASGTALFAKPGETTAGVAVKRVESEQVVVLVEGKERTYSIGQTLTLPASARGVLQPLRPAGSVKTESKRYTGATKLPELSETKKMSILERLKARRRASKLRAEGKDPEAAPKEPQDAPRDEPTKTGAAETGAKGGQPDSNPDEGTPDEGTPDEGTPDDDAPDEGTPDEGAPDEGAPDEGAPDEGAPDDGEPDEGAPDDGPTGENPNDDPDAPADESPAGDDSSEDDPQDSSAPAEESSPSPQSEDKR